VSDPKNWKILFVGDLKHSRVFSSHLHMAKVFGYQVGMVCPPEFFPSLKDVQSSGVEVLSFLSLEEGLSWCDFYYALRVQRERHITGSFDRDSYTRSFQLSRKMIEPYFGQKFLMHPGPINWGVELHSDLEPMVSQAYRRQDDREQTDQGQDTRMQINGQMAKGPGNLSLVAEQVASGVWVRQALLATALLGVAPDGVTLAGGTPHE
jgi:aspartate carbamoyltransferase catalytic subunit